MKKFLALFLALLTILSVSLVACGNKDNDDDGDGTTTEDPDNGVIWTGDGDGTTTGDDDDDVTTKAPNLNWVDKAAKVYVAYVDSCNIRTSDSIKSDNKAGVANFGQSFDRVRYNDEWTEVSIEGQLRYIKTDFLTTEAARATFKDVAETTVYVTAETALTLRWALYSEETAENTAAAYVDRGDALVQNGVNEDGSWIRVKYDGKTLYCKADQVSNTMPSDDATGTTTGNVDRPGAMG